MAHCAHIPAFVLHQVTCQFATGDTLFGPLNLSLEPSLCGLVGRNGVGKTRLLRLLAGLDSPAGGHIERAAAVAWWRSSRRSRRRPPSPRCWAMRRF
jgi:ATPase subunit of ABC transporter with duplicated ATPase domains